MPLIFSRCTMMSRRHQSRRWSSITGAAAFAMLFVVREMSADIRLRFAIISLSVAHVYPIRSPATPKVLENPQVVIVSLSISGLRLARVMCSLPSKMMSSQSSSLITVISLSTAMSAMALSSSLVMTLPAGLWGLQTKMSFVLGVTSSLRVSSSNL